MFALAGMWVSLLGGPLRSISKRIMALEAKVTELELREELQPSQRVA